ncbi:MAG: 2-oxoacid:acceptor oxidoreductase family protein, partial [Chloroflexota bacterium]|nr:2-oxoacid:acceptor oxidoreductase family protein [Chloroflexota bacterium]
MLTKTDILMTGVGGQGVIMASDILASAALATGYDVKKTDSLGMAQRGGSVTSHVRMAEKVYSPMISQGSADFLMSYVRSRTALDATIVRPGRLTDDPGTGRVLAGADTDYGSIPRA